MASARTQLAPKLRRALLLLLILTLAALAARRIVRQSTVLLVGDGPQAATDLRARWDETRLWVDGGDVYTARQRADYPPASYGILALLIAPWPWPVARLLWWVLDLLAIAWLARLGSRAAVEAGMGSQARLALALLPWAATATAVTLSGGQVGLVSLAAVSAALELATHRHGRASAVLAAALFVLALLKPTVSAPFFWLLLLVRPAAALLAAGGYAAATASACALQERPTAELLTAWIDNGHRFAGIGYGNLAAALRSAAPGLAIAASLGLLALLGVWTLRRRGTDPWLALGVAAATARLWTHHYEADDVLVLLVAFALLRPATAVDPAGRIPAAIALGACCAALMLPTRLVADPAWGPGDWSRVFQTAALLLALAVLLHRAAAERRAQQPPAGSEIAPVATRSAGLAG